MRYDEEDELEDDNKFTAAFATESESIDERDAFAILLPLLLILLLLLPLPLSAFDFVPNNDTDDIPCETSNI